MSAGDENEARAARSPRFGPGTDMRRRCKRIWIWTLSDAGARSGVGGQQQRVSVRVRQKGQIKGASEIQYRAVRQRVKGGGGAKTRGGTYSLRSYFSSHAALIRS